MRFAFPALAASLLAACTPTDLPEGGLSVSHPQGDGTCNADAVQQHIGTRATDTLGATILEQSGSHQLRWGGPDTAFTMDYREDRVNAIYDADGTITRIYCG